LGLMMCAMKKGMWELVLLLLFALTGGCGGSGGSINPADAGADNITGRANLIPNTYIVEVQTFGTSKSEIELEVAAKAEDCRLHLNGEILHLLTKAIHGFVMVLPAGVSPTRFFEYDYVVWVEPDAVAAVDKNFSAGLAVNLPIQQVPPGLRRINADDPTLLARINGLDGPGERIEVGIAVLDSGIDLAHPDLNVSPLGINIVNPGLPPDDVYGHGTHVAGIAAALDNAFGVVGVAPGATLYPVKVLNDTGYGATSDIITGVDWVAANLDKVAVANMSLHIVYPSSLLQSALRRVVEAGVVVVTSAGNRGVDVYGPDLIYNTTDDRAPACYPEVLAVSAMADYDGRAGGLSSYGAGALDDTIVGYSNSSSTLYPGALWSPPGKAISLAAPGYAILSTVPGGLYDTKSGTSMAAPHVAGVAARLIAVRGRDVNLDGISNAADVTMIRQILINGGQVQSQWRMGNTLDPDGNPEPLVDARTI